MGSVTTEHDQKRKVNFNFENKPAKVKKIFLKRCDAG